MRSLNEIFEELRAAELTTNEHGTLFPDCTYEDGVTAALLWLIGYEGQKTLMAAELAITNEPEVCHG